MQLCTITSLRLGMKEFHANYYERNKERYVERIVEHKKAFLSIQSQCAGLIP